MNKIEKEVRKHFKDEYGWEMADEEYLEIYDSLYHLGKAIYLYSLQKNKDISSKVIKHHK